MRIRNVFHASLLCPWRHDSTAPPPAQILFVKDNEEFEVDKVIQHRDVGKGRAKKREYLVLWRGFSDENATWEPLSNLRNCSASIKQYWQDISWAARS